jgi:hypothetical protein
MPTGMAMYGIGSLALEVKEVNVIATIVISVFIFRVGVPQARQVGE